MINVLFLDDEEAILNTYRRMIRLQNINGFYAHNSLEARDVLNFNSIHLIISDYRLEQETGLDFLKIIRKENSQIPMIIISGYAEEKFIQSAMKTHVIQDYLIKPITMNNFREILNRFFVKEDL